MTITPAEKKAGYTSITVKTGFGSILGSDETTQIVAKMVSKTERVVKVEDGSYQRQVLTKDKDSDLLDSWRPVGDMTDDHDA